MTKRKQTKPKTLYGRHYDRIHALWERACLGYKCRMRWRRRHMKGYIALAQQKYDPIGGSLYAQCQRYFKLLEYLKENPQGR